MTIDLPRHYEGDAPRWIGTGPAKASVRQQPPLPPERLLPDKRTSCAVIGRTCG
ncbi:hypothetical protein HYR99_04875 [Candidatus Poribacteria bacterium]|nr:hypothetical protein [Candidatus Poribacteria bacterium]